MLILWVYATKQLTRLKTLLNKTMWKLKLFRSTLFEVYKTVFFRSAFRPAIISRHQVKRRRLAAIAEHRPRARCR